MEYIISYLNCGKLYNNWEDSVEIVVTKLSDILHKILPFFEAYPIYGSKSLDLLDFTRIVYMMKSKIHLTKEGIDKIIKIKEGMNFGRSITRK
jgi:hypothetical protein